jgi:hypothetical protein
MQLSTNPGGGVIFFRNFGLPPPQNPATPLLVSLLTPGAARQVMAHRRESRSRMLKPYPGTRRNQNFSSYRPDFALMDESAGLCHIELQLK